jgi:hypothetical protein
LEAARLSHPNLLKTWAAGETDLDGERVVYAAFERPDDTLVQTLPERALTPDEARDVLDAVVPAVDYLHQRGLVHGDLRAASIVAVGNTVKLTMDSISRSPDRDPDKKGIAATIVEMLTRTRPATDEALSRAARKLPASLRDVALTNLQPPAELITEPVFEPITVPQRRKPLIPLLAAAAVVVAALLGWRMFRSEPEQEPAASRQPAVYRPSPVNEAPAKEPERAAAPSPVPAPATPARTTPPPPTTADSKPARSTPQVNPAAEWAVVAAIYNDFDAAEQRATSMRKRWPKFTAQVYPGKGEARRYMIVLGRGLNKNDADRLRDQARQSGMPDDTYVTKLFNP